MQISAKSVDMIMPIVMAIDEQLEKEQPDRDNLEIQTPDPHKLKNLINAYKSTYKRDTWTSKFFIVKKSDKVVIDFNPKKGESLAYSIKAVKQGNEEDSLISRMVLVPSTIPGAGIPKEMTDAQVTTELLTENPSALLVSIPHLGEDTQKYLNNPANNPASALINLLHRRGYKYEVINHKLRIFT